jgi:hypothetical protein
MDFNQLMARMRELDQPVSGIQDEGCGDPVGMPPVNTPATPPVAPPSMSVNLNAQGMDNIEDLLKLITKVNPDMGAPNLPPLPTMGAEPSIMSIKPPTPELPPLKMLPDLDKEGPTDAAPDSMNLPPEHDKDHELVKTLDKDKDGDHDMDDHKQEEPPKKDKEEAFGNSLGDSEPEEKGHPFDAAGDDLHKEKKTFPKVAGGDNPMQKTESTDLRSQIRAELLQRLAEAKGAK